MGAYAEKKLCMRNTYMAVMWYKVYDMIVNEAQDKCVADFFFVLEYVA
jgi:hypothetical protein